MDLDSDGDLDIVIGLPAGAGVGVFEQLAPGQFSAVARVLATIPGAVEFVEPSDLDKNGDQDFVVATNGLHGGPLVRVSSLGDGSLGEVTPFPSGVAAVSRFLAADLDGDGDVDVLAAPRYTGTVVLYVSDAFVPIGSNECGPAVVSSTGGPAEITALGSNVLGEQSLLLRVTSLPANSLVLFLASETPAFVMGAGGSLGNLCLGGSIGRFTGPGEVQSSGAIGTAELAVRLGAMPQPNGPVPALAGQTWRFQAWNRDVLAGQAVSNFSDAIAVAWL